jgi:chemotaxis protein methyltransferase CheR
VTYENGAGGWRLVVSANGVGHDGALTAATGDMGSGGMGTVIIKALVCQLGAELDIASSDAGLTVSVTQTGFS